MQKLMIFRKINSGRELISSQVFPDNRHITCFHVLSILFSKQRTEDVIGIGTPCHINISTVSTFYERDGVLYSYKPENLYYNPDCQWTQLNIDEPDIFSGQNLYLAFECYKTGYVLRCKGSDYGFLKIKTALCFEYLSLQNAQCTDINNCQVWKSKSVLLNWCKYNRSFLKLLSKNGWKFSAEPHNYLFEDDELKRISRLSKSEQKCEKRIAAKLNRLLNDINSCN